MELLFGHRNNKRQGFSLIEMLVVITVTVILSTMVITWSVKSRAQVAFLVERTKLGQLIERAKFLSLSTYVEAANSCGYGIRMTYPRTYALVRYTDTTCASASTGTYTPIETFTLSQDLIFERGRANELQAVVFVPPDPRTMFQAAVGGPVPTQGIIYLATQDLSNQATITIGRNGAIDF